MWALTSGTRSLLRTRWLFYTQCPNLKVASLAEKLYHEWEARPGRSIANLNGERDTSSFPRVSMSEPGTPGTLF